MATTTTEIPRETMQSYMAAFGQECLDLARELAARGDRDAQELLDRIEEQGLGEVA